MNTLTKKIVLSGLVMLLSACAYHPHHYSSYPSNGGYYPNNRPYYPGYNNYQGHHHHHPRPQENWGQGRPYGYQSNNYYYQNNYNIRPQPMPRPMPGYNHHDHKNYPPRWNGQYGPRANDRPRINDNHPHNWGWQSHNDQPRPGTQPMVSHHTPPAIPRGQANPGWGGHHQDHGSRPANLGGWQGRANQPAPRPQFAQAQHDIRQNPAPRNDRPSIEPGHAVLIKTRVNPTKHEQHPIHR